MKKTKRTVVYNNRFVLAACGIAAGIMLIVYFCTGVFPLGGNTILRMDLYHQYGPLFAELYDRMFSGASPAYSWTSGLGSCFLGNYFNYLSSPIGAIVVFFGHKHVPEAIAAMILIKAALSAGTFTYYLKRAQRSHTIMSATFGVLYAFCAYMLAYYWNVMWLDAMLLLPLILLGIERIIDHGKAALYIVTLALSMFSNYYMSYMLCLFAVIYFLYYYFAHYGILAKLQPSAAFEDEQLKNKLYNSRFLRCGILFAVGSIAAAGLIAAALLPTYRVLQNCSATSGTFPSEWKSYFTFFDFFANHLSGLTTTIRSSGDDVLPNVYCGALAILLAPLYFFTKTISKKEKAVTLVLLAVFYLSFNLNALNYIWHGFHFPNDLPYRFSFMYSFVLLVMAYKTFVRLGEFSSRQIAVVGAALIAFIFLVQDIKSKNVTDLTVYASIIYLVVYVLMLTLFKSHRSMAGSIAILLCVCVCSEAIVCDTQSFPNTVTRSSYEDDYDDFRTLKEKLDTIEQDDFYRMELTNLRTRMDNSWFGYNGISVFSSMAYELLASLESQLGMMSNKINSYTYNPQTPVYNLMHALKYVVNNSATNVISDAHYSQVANAGKYTAYRVKDYLPLAYCVNSAVEYWDYTNSDPFLVQENFFNLASGVSDSVFAPLPISYVNYNNTDPFTESLNGNKFYFQKSDRKADSEASATFTVTAQTAGNIYIYFEADGATSKDITVNSESGSITHNISQKCILDVGAFETGESVHVTIPFERENGYVTFYAYTLDNAVFQKGYEKLAANTLELTGHSDTTLEGKFTANERCLLYTSIPYDNGWQVEIDGETVDQHSVLEIGGALLGVRVEKGNHTIRFHYSVPGLKTGLTISVVTLLLLIFWMLHRQRKQRRGINTTALPQFPFENRSFSERLFLPQKRTVIAPKPSNDSPMFVQIQEVHPKRERFSPPKRIKREVFFPPIRQDKRFIVKDDVQTQNDES